MGAAYTMLAYKLNKWSWQIGARLENTQIFTKLSEIEQLNQRYLDFFPSFHTSYKVSNQFSLQLGYSRRIQRPDMWDFSPFESISNNLNLLVDNTTLGPEYTNAFELTLIKDFKRASLSAAVFRRNTTNVFNQIVTVRDSLTITTPQNVGQSQYTGLEVNNKIDVAKWFSLLADANWNYFQRFGTFESTNFDFSNTMWTIRLTTKFKLPAGTDIEVRARYNSAEQQVLRETQSIMYADLGIRKKLLKGRSILNLSIRDVFNSRIYKTEVNQPSFYFYEENQWNRRQVTIGVSFGFGKGDAMEFSGQKTF